ncbi:MAG: type II toxin-antitoxin system VapC family toxin [Burkholderiaceae bacterium]|nr:type II toxin-antitoxin system VapC family toxin [Burkholderiaceae bacterium]
MYLIDTNVISEARKGANTDPGVTDFFSRLTTEQIPAYLSVVTVGELRRGVELIRHRGDTRQAEVLAFWLDEILDQYAGNILPLDAEAAQVWGRLRVPHPEHELDKQIAAIALINGLTVVTRNTADFTGTGTGVNLLNPFRLLGQTPS